MPPRISFRDFAYTETPTGTMVVIVTDIPCHLFIRWTILEPWIHSKPVLRRGMWLNDDVRFCFDVFSDCEQNEPGDTLTHTFTCGLANLNSNYWWYPWGYVEGEVSPSTGPIFKIVTPPVWPPPPEPVRYAWNRNKTTGGAIQPFEPGYKIAPTFQILEIPTKSVTFHLYSFGIGNIEVRVSLSLVDETGKPLDSMLVSQTYNLLDGVMYSDSDEDHKFYEHTLTLPWDYELNTQYALVILTIAGTPWWVRHFRLINWNGPIDWTEGNFVCLHATHPTYPEWTFIRFGDLCFEAWGTQ